MERNSGVPIIYNKMTIKSESVKLDELCRICARTSGQMVPIFDNDSHQNLPEKINKNMPIFVSENDTLPTQLCYTCAVLVLAWTDLIKGCIRAQQKLVDIRAGKNIGNIPTVVECMKVESKADDSNNLYENQSSTSETDGSSVDALDFSNEERYTMSRRQSYDHSDSLPSTSYSLPPTIKEEYEDISDDDAEVVNKNEESRRIDPHKLLKNNERSKELIKKAQIIINGRVYYHCKQCNKNFTTAYSFSSHVKTHTGENLHECHLCKKHFGLKHNLTRHINKVHTKLKKSVCSVCRQMFDYKEKTNKHGKVIDERPSTCEPCKNSGHPATMTNFNECRTVYTPLTLSNYAGIVVDDCPVQCVYCKKFFPTNSSYLLHVPEHGINPNNYRTNS